MKKKRRELADYLTINQPKTGRDQLLCSKEILAITKLRMVIRAFAAVRTLLGDSRFVPEVC
jgi:hypothetical protein